jgi:5-deoxy-glucuronate isomerase
MHIAPYDNANRPLVDVGDPRVPLCYFNIVRLRRGESFDYALADYESAVIPATGSVDVDVGGRRFDAIGRRTADVWDGEPEGVYVPTRARATLRCISERAEVFVAGARFEQALESFAVRAGDLDTVQYGSDETKTHRKIKHIFGTKHRDRIGRLLVSELFTVGCGGWSGFPPHKHDADRLPAESRHDEIYNFRFRPRQGFGLQLLQRDAGSVGDAYHLVDGSTILVDRGYHPCVVAPGYAMYYFTILAGLSQRPLVQFFHPDHAYQLETIPGIKDMIAKFK